MKQKLTGIFMAVCLFALVISASIAAPILVRPFYYCQIAPLEIAEDTGYSEAQIRAAYDDVMDFLVKGEPFGTGALHYSAEGKAHFADCRGLFLLDFWVLGVSAVLLVALWLLRRRDPQVRRARHIPAFFTAIASCVVFTALGIWGAVDFDALFVAFHTTFFPGKSNWIFDPTADEIINILPERFFMHCAALIAALIIAANITFFIVDILHRKKALHK